MTSNAIIDSALKLTRQLLLDHWNHIDTVSQNVGDNVKFRITFCVDQTEANQPTLSAKIRYAQTWGEELTEDIDSAQIVFPFISAGEQEEE